MWYTLVDMYSPLARSCLLQTILSCLIGGLLVYPTALVNATTTPTTSPDLTSSSVEEIISVINNDRSAAVATNRQALRVDQGDRSILTERTRTRFLNLGANISNRLEATHTRLTQIAIRLERRIAKEAVAGYDTASAERALAAAQLALSATTDTLAEIDTDMIQFVQSHNPRQSWQHVRTIYQTAQQNLRDAQTALRISIQELQAATQIIADDAIVEQ